MVRKKMKRAPEASEHPNVDLNNIVASWLKALDLSGHECVPVIPLNVDIFSLLQSSQFSSDQSYFSQVRGLQALRAAVAGGAASARDLHSILLTSLLLFIDPDTSPLRKSVKSLLYATENATRGLGSGTGADEMVELVVARFLEHFRVMIPSTSPPPPTMVRMGVQQRTQQENSALRMVASLRWLAEVPAGKRALLKAQDGCILMGCIAVLDEALDMQASVIKRWHGRGDAVSGRALEVAGAELEPKDTEESGVAAADLSAALDACSEVLKTAASLMSLTKEWDVARLPQGDVTARHMCFLCLLVLSTPTVQREAITHASTVLVHVAMASWRGSGRWPPGSAASGTTRTATSDADTTAPPSGREQEEVSSQLTQAASTMIFDSFFSGDDGGQGNEEDEHADTDGTRALIASFLPLPPGSGVAVCRAVLHIVDPGVLLVRGDFKNGGSTEGSSGVVGEVGKDNLLLGPILNAILSRCGSESGLQLRFFALQVLEAWCSRATAFAQCGLALHSGFPVSSAKREHNGDGVDVIQTLSEVMGVAMKALVHPAKLISSLAPALLEHVVNLRHSEQSVLEAREAGDSGDVSEWECLAERVLQQPATFKGKYVALGVLLPRVGALRLLEICPSLVEQLVWAVGVRGNVSGQATALLLQFLKVMSTDVERSSSGGLSPATESASTLCASGGEEAGSKDGNTSHVASKARVDAKIPVGRGKATGASTQRAASLCRKWWLAPAAAALMQEDSWSRSHVAAYLLPEVFKFDPASAAALSAEVREHVCGEEGDTNYHPPLLPDAGGCLHHDVRRMWAMIEVARFARKCGATTGLTLAGSCVDNRENGASAGLLQLSEVRWASLHVDETLRMSALSLLCTDLRMTTVPPAAETDLLREVLPYSLKVFGAQSRQLLLRAVQTLLVRMRETVRVCVKELSGQSTGGRSQLHRGADRFGVNGSKRRKHKQADGAQYGSGSGSVASPSVSTGAARDGKEGEGETAAQTVERVEVFVRWLCEEVLRSLYPGCPFEREVLGLEMVQLVLSELVPVDGSNGTDQRETPLAKVVSSSIFRRRWVDTLLALLGSSWDRTRSLSYSVLARFPCPLTGYQGAEGGKRLAAEGLRLSGSGRQQESDRGALILRLVFVSHARGLGLDVPLFAAEIGDKGRGGDGGSESKGGQGLGGVDMSDSDAGGQEGGSGDAAVRFLEGLRAVLSHRLGSLQRVWDQSLQRQEGTAIPNALDAVNTPPLNTHAAEASIALLPHGVLLAVHHVLLDSDQPKGGRATKGRKPRGPNRRSAPVPGDGATNDHTNTSTIISNIGDSEARVKSTLQLEKRRTVVGALLEQAFRALRLSLLIVGEHSGGVGGAQVCCEGGEGAVGGHSSSCGGGGSGEAGGGDVATHTTRSARSVNANGHVGMVSVDSHGHAVSTPLVTRPGESFAGAGDDRVACVGVKMEAGRSAAQGQRAVVGAWLLAKEACRCLATMVTASPLPAAQVAHAQMEATSSDANPKVEAADGAGASTPVGEAGSMESLLTDADVTKIGNTLLESLLSLKHMGCVASAQAAFQAVCEALLHGGRRNPSLMSLPSVWLDKLLQQLDGSKQEFVLRRSTGLALAFVSILRAEPRSVEPVLLPRCMRHLLALAQPERCDPSNVGRALEQRAATAGDWKSTVHALNVLRVVFVDATLADDVGPYVTQATMAAVCGFEDPTWAVRNSSMMVFASMMQRAVGGAKNSGPANPYSDGAKRPHSCRGAITAEAFFQQHKKLHPFLLSQLKRATDHASQDSATASPSASAGVLGGQEGPPPAKAKAKATSRAEMHPVLYPILLLLARLRASGGAAETEAEKNEGGASVAVAGLTSTAAFVPLVMQCASNPHYLARAASSRALAALVPPARAPGIIAELLVTLPKDASDDRCFGAGAHNRIHGTLLQVTELLIAARASQSGDQSWVTSASTHGQEDSPSPSKADDRPDSVFEKVAMAAGAAVLNLLWLADPALSPCPPIRHAMLNALQVLAGFTMDGRGSVGKVRSALKTSWEVNFADTVRPGSAAGRVVPGRSVLVAAVVGTAVRRRLGRALVEEAGSAGVGPTNGEEGAETSPANEVQFAASLLTSPDTDVQDSAIKATKKFFGPGSGHDRKARVSQKASLLVWAAAANALMFEVHPPNVRRLVRLLSRVGMCLRGFPLPDSVGLLWDHLRGLCEDGAAGGSEEVHAGALEVMGVIVRLGKPVAEASRSAVDLVEYAGLLEAAADALMPVSTRAASAASLASSRLLGTAAPGHLGDRTGPGSCDIGAFVRLWFVALSLLQDDEERVRICAARACAAAADSSSPQVNAGEGVPASSEGGGRVDIVAVDLALARLAVLAEDPRDDGRAAEQLALNLLRVLASPPETSGENLTTVHDNVDVDAVTDAGAGAQGFGGGDVDVAIGETSEDGEMIFGREERNQFQEPGLFALVAAPYLRRVLLALDARDRMLPGAVVQGLADVLDGLAEKLEGLKDAPSATWLPAVYLGITSATAVGGAVLEFTVSHRARKHHGDGHGGREGDVDLSREVARAVKACEDFEAVLDGNESVHPGVSRGVGLALRAARL